MTVRQNRVGVARTVCPLWVKSGHRGTYKQCPLYPQKRTLNCAVCISPSVHKRSGQSMSALPVSYPQLNVYLFSNRQGVIHVNAEVSNGALDFPVTKQELDGA